MRWYQSHSNNPLRDDELALSYDLLDHFRPIWLTKVWASTISCLHCPVDMSSNHIQRSMIARHNAAVLQEGGAEQQVLTVVEGFKEACQSLLQYEDAIMVQLSYGTIQCCSARQTSEWQQLATQFNLEDIVRCGFQPAAYCPTNTRQSQNILQGTRQDMLQVH